MSTSRPSAASASLTAVIDVILVVVFVLIGRRSHTEGLTLMGTLETAWPFLAGLTVGWLVFRAWRRPRRIVATGIGVWLSTVIVGMVLRSVSGQGVQLSFVIVTTIVLGVFLLGSRWLTRLALRRRALAP